MVSRVRCVLLRTKTHYTLDPLGGGDCGSGYVGGRSSIRVIGRMWIVRVVVWILHIRTSREGDVESWERVEVVGRTVVGGGGGVETVASWGGDGGVLICSCSDGTSSFCVCV